MEEANCNTCKHRIKEHETRPHRSRLFCRRERLALVDMDTTVTPAKFLCSDYEEKDEEENNDE